MFTFSLFLRMNAASFCLPRNNRCGTTVLAVRTTTLYSKNVSIQLWYTGSVMVTLTSPAFGEGKSIPPRFTCEGENISPELHIKNVPAGAVSLALLMEDPDIPESVKQNRGLEVFDHWVVFNIPAETTVLAEGQKPPGVEGMNSAGQGYTGPCPPDGEHRYFFKLYALDTLLDLNRSATKARVEQAMKGHVLEKAQLIGVYKKVNG